MKKVILIFVTIVLSGLLYAKDNKSTDALLREIDGIIKNRQTYGVEKETRIADLKRLLAEATSDEQRYGFCGRLFDEYRAYNLDSSFVYAQRKEELAHRMDKLDYLDDAAMNMAEVMVLFRSLPECIKKRWNYWGRLIRKRCPIISMVIIIICIALFTD